MPCSTGKAMSRGSDSACVASSGKSAAKTMTTCTSSTRQTPSPAALHPHRHPHHRHPLRRSTRSHAASADPIVPPRQARQQRIVYYCNTVSPEAERLTPMSARYSFFGYRPHDSGDADLFSTCGEDDPRAVRWTISYAAVSMSFNDRVAAGSVLSMIIHAYRDGLEDARNGNDDD